ncbi:TolC family protein [Perlucidibaca aquatica]|uniref:TolC family protein n=1 Tax=Perlucidibaca aquatica TaxID=1852776 RepID=UPI00083A1431|nr:TolC family protein [Perlucidibaca aquatica]
MKRPRHHITRVVAVALLASALGSCASLSRDGSEGEVRANASRILGQPLDDPSRLSPESRLQYQQVLLAEPLNVNEAVALALNNNPGLQRTFAELRMTEAEVIAATRLRNPGISLARLTQGGDREIDRAISFDLIGLLTLPVRGRIEKQRFESAKLDATRSILMLARDTRRAYFAAVAGTQRARYAADVQTAAEAGRELARGLAQAGNISRLDAAREQAFYAEATAQRARADAEALTNREQLIRLLGLPDAAALKLPDLLPELPGAARELGNVEQQAMDQRVDVQIAKRSAENTAHALKLSKITRFVNVLDVGYQYNTFSTQPKETGFEVSLELPLFDFGTTRVAQAEAIYRRSLADVAETAINARSEARESYARYRTTYDLAKHYRDEVVPLQKQISDELLLRYNGMLISTFELLAQSREQIASTDAYLSALQDFWAAEADLASVLQGLNSNTNTPPN